MDKLLKLLCDEHVITEEQYQRVLKECENSAKSFDTILEQSGFLREEALLDFLGEKFHLSVVNWDTYQPDPDLLALIPEHIASKYTIFPYAIERGRRQNKITLAIANPLNLSAIESDISFMTGSIVKTEIASTRAILDAIRTYYGTSETAPRVPDVQARQEKRVILSKVMPSGFAEFDALLPELLDAADLEAEEDVLAELDHEHPSTKFLIELLGIAVDRGFSEIHIDPYGQEQRIRFRLHGVLHEHASIPEQIGRGILQRLRRMSQRAELSPITTTGMKNKQGSWSGSFSTTYIQGKFLTVHFTTYPSISGEKVLLKIKNGVFPENIDTLGFDENSSKVLERILSKPQGLLLLVSPPNHGKTTTLRTILRQFVQPEKVAISVEPMVEVILPHVIQIPYDPQTAYQDWYAILSYHAPDFLALNNLEHPLLEQLALEFASSAIVLASFTAHDSADGLCTFLTRLGDIFDKQAQKGLLLALDSLGGIVSQRLIRTICPHCKEKVALSNSDQEFLHQFTTTGGEFDYRAAYVGKGCSECLETGYSGQTGLFEIMKLDKSLKQFLLQSQPLSSFQVRSFLAEMSIDTMKSQAFQKIQQGVTSVAEIRRVLF
ncbi:type IV pilus assembly protein PilB [Candidatus Vecturithrix granuli]|uniref:Type IV pilus assembly protein PilB n=1 Tax=Vecturithrix granuli TaxID=1499967 RepID=A0A081C6P7_VECG1|nr:type IV pilus assembly protein PilB [Candidatus Vecturithrix granuli]